MNIWVIGRSFPLSINNMIGSFELEQSKMLAKHGNKVSYLACVFHPFKKVKKWGFASWNEDNVDVYTYSQFYAIERMKLHWPLFQSYVWKKFLKKIESVTGVPDIIHVHYPTNITIAQLILNYREKGTKVICTEHWTQVLKKVIDNHEINQLKQYVTESDAFICVGHPLKKSVEELTGVKKDLFVIPNILNDLFVPLKKNQPVFRFVAVGVLFPHKQFDKIINAFAATFKDNSSVELMIVGGGPYLDKLKKLADDLGISNKVKFKGKMSRKETAKIVGESNALICFSNCETFGVPIIEAWGCGIPVIATTAAAVNEKWDNRLGMQIEPGNLERLKECMRYIYDNIDSYDESYILKYAKEHYSESVVYDQLMKIYTK